MNCVAVFESGNYAFRLCTILEKKGYVFEVVSTPCQIAKGGCGYSMKFPEECKDIVISEARAYGLSIMDIYKIQPGFTKNKYIKIL